MRTPSTLRCSKNKQRPWRQRCIVAATARGATTGTTDSSNAADTRAHNKNSSSSSNKSRAATTAVAAAAPPVTTMSSMALLRRLREDPRRLRPAAPGAVQADLKRVEALAVEMVTTTTTPMGASASD